MPWASGFYDYIHFHNNCTPTWKDMSCIIGITLNRSAQLKLIKSHGKVHSNNVKYLNTEDKISWIIYKYLGFFESHSLSLSFPSSNLLHSAFILSLAGFSKTYALEIHIHGLFDQGKCQEASCKDWSVVWSKQ